MKVVMGVSLRERIEQVIRLANGRWKEIFIASGIDAYHLESQNRPCPLCGGTDRFSFTDYQKRGNYLCRQCGVGDGIALIQKYRQCTFFEALDWIDAYLGIEYPKNMPVLSGDEESEEVSIEIIQARERMALWAKARPVQEGDPVWEYLLGRGLDPRACYPEIRYLANAEYREGDEVKVLPVMLSRVTDGRGVVINLHRTYLKNEQKASVAKPKKLMVGTVKDGAVQLGPPVQEILGLAEGIETAMAAHELTGIPVWATLGCANLKSFAAIPMSVRQVFIFADNDANFAGQSAAYQLAHTLSIHGLEVQVLVPSHMGQDWLDVLQSQERREK